ncbi:MAG: argininosuccinate synthase [Candidatus Marinimicrobia bacterium]|nr:argininosuccinate synthase [Candidatus Neomarinimicrobiota bacterium]MCF7828668.1 argininosuccinate synthase [Candidatus Neomarinimicrobiota bacterium]MCF7880409.1 argininosuccinate synthase [Candidatus Neomarinimicrobiota bacterium]
MESKKVVLAYSGGLDTSVLLKWLDNQGYEVICFVGNVGQQEDFDAVRAKALETGASKVYVEDLRREFVTEFIFPALRGNARYEGRYLLGTSLARPLLAKAQIEIADKEGAQYVAHGATGKGNDQVRFELTYYALNPKITVISPWKNPEFLDQFAGRADLQAYAEKFGIPISSTNGKVYSEDENLMHISHEAGELEDPLYEAPEGVYSRTKSPKDAPDEETKVEIQFRNGNPVKVTNLNDDVTKDDPLELFEYLNDLAYENGIGRVDMVENRYIGIKSRGIYETPGATILWEAHRDLEGLAMDKEVMHLRDMLIPKFSELIYNGYWFSPEMDFIMSAFNKSQEAIDGTVIVSLYKGNVYVTGRKSPTALYDQDMSSMEVEGGFDATDSRGFINISAIRLKAHNLVLRDGRPYDWRIIKEELLNETVES